MGHSLIRDSFGQFSRGFVRLGEVATTSFFDPSSLYRLRNNGIDGINLGLATEPAQRFDRYAEVVCCKWKRHKYTMSGGKYRAWRLELLELHSFTFIIFKGPNHVSCIMVKKEKSKKKQTNKKTICFLIF